MYKKRGGFFNTLKKSILNTDKIAPKIINEIHFEGD